MLALWIAIATGLLAGGFALTGSYAGRRVEHAQWRRNERRVAYLKYVGTVSVAIQMLITAINDADEENDVDHDEPIVNPHLFTIDADLRELLLLGPDDIAASANALRDYTVWLLAKLGPDDVEAAAAEFAYKMRRFNEAARAALKTRH